MKAWDERVGRMTVLRALPWAGLVIVALSVIASVAGLGLASTADAALYILFLVCVLALRRDVLSAVILVAVAIIQDWYQLLPIAHGFHFTAIVASMALLALIFLSQRDARPWQAVRPVDLLFWGAFLLLGVLAIPRGDNIARAHSYLLTQSLAYYAYIFVAAAAFWLVGTLIARGAADVRRLCVFLAALATLLAIHAIVQTITGHLPFLTPAWAHYLADPTVNYFRLADGQRRATTFFVAPDIAESFFSAALFLSLGLLVASRAWAERALYAGEIVLILLALLFTYGPVGWLAVGCGVLIFVVVGLRGRARLAFVGALAAALVVGGLVLAREWQALLKHATSPHELGLRTAIWRTALNIIHANPITGIGLGTGTVYQLRQRPYLDPSLTRTYSNPQNSFLEFAAFAGIPVLLVFLAILGRALMRAIVNYRLADARLRPVMLGGLLAILACCINGLSDLTFTAVALVPFIYVILGALASPRLRAALEAETTAIAEPVWDPAFTPQRALPVRYGPPLSNTPFTAPSNVPEVPR